MAVAVAAESIAMITSSRAAQHNIINTTISPAPPLPSSSSSLPSSALASEAVFPLVLPVVEFFVQIRVDSMQTAKGGNRLKSSQVDRYLMLLSSCLFAHLWLETFPICYALFCRTINHRFIVSQSDGHTLVLL